MSPRVTKRGERTRARLIEATLSVVGEVGYARASTRAIADAAGMSEGALYRHFPDKAALFFARDASFVTGEVLAVDGGRLVAGEER